VSIEKQDKTAFAVDSEGAAQQHQSRWGGLQLNLFKQQHLHSRADSGTQSTLQAEGQYMH
jgi:hypothetical protein